MKINRLLDILLWIILLFGFLGAAKISYDNINGSACPTVGFVPICYVVLVAYALMIAALIIRQRHCKHYFFSVGWGLAFTIALLGSLAELFAGGGVCPSTGSSGIRGASTGIPMCYISLVLLIISLILFLQGSYKRACARCDIADARAQIKDKEKAAGT